MALLIQKGANIDYRPKAASTSFQSGYFISYDGSGGVIPAESASLYGSATPILGIILTDVSSSDVDFAQTTKVPFQYSAGFKFLVPVSAGTAVASMIGSTYDVDGTNPGQIDLSISGTQLRVVNVLSSSLVEVEVALQVIEG